MDMDMGHESSLGKITLRGLKTHGYHGVYDYEREQGQIFIADVEMILPMPVDDDLAKTVDYSTLAKAILGIIEGEPVDLIETLASHIVERCLAEDLVQEVTVCVHKPQAPLGFEVTDVSVTITRRKQ